MEQAPTNVAESGCAPEEDAVNRQSMAWMELREFLRHNGRVRDATTLDYQFLDRSTSAKHVFAPGDEMDTFFDLADAARADGCVMHLNERVSDGAAGVMIDFDQKQLSASVPTVFTQSKMSEITRVVASAIHGAIAQSAVRAVAPTTSDVWARQRANPTGIGAPAGGGAAGGAAGGAPAQMRIETYHIFIIRRKCITRDPVRPDVLRDGIHVLVPDLWFVKYCRMGIVRMVAEALSGMRTCEDKEMVDLNSANVQPHLVGSCKLKGVLYELVYAVRVRDNVMHDEHDKISPAQQIDGLDVAALLRGNSGDIETEGDGIPINLVYELSLTQYQPARRGHATWLRKRVPPLSQMFIDGREEGERHPTADSAERADERSFEERIGALLSTNATATYINELLAALPARYAEEYPLWLGVLLVLGDCAAARGEFGEYGLLAEAFSRRSATKFNAAAFARTWANVRGRAARRVAAPSARVTARSLEYWVRTENPAGYALAKSHDVRNFFISRVYESGGALDHDTIAEVMRRQLRGVYATDADAADKEAAAMWYQFVDDTVEDRATGELYKWRSLRAPYGLTEMIAVDIYVQASEIRGEVVARAQQLAAQDPARSKRYSDLADAIAGSMRQLRQNGFQRAVIEMLSHKLNVRGFVESLDKERGAIGVENGVLVFLAPRTPAALLDDAPPRADADGATPASLDDHEGIGATAPIRGQSPLFEPRLIRGFNDLRVSRSTRCEWVEYNPACPRVRALLAAYHDIYIEPDVCEFILMFLSTWIDACDPARILVLLGGGGSNGKSLSMLYPAAALGLRYAKPLRMQLLTESRERANEANSALMALKDLRGAYFDEAAEGDELNIARVKTLITPGIQSGRDLYSREEQFRNTTNCAAISNYDFIVNATDHGTWDRLVYYTCKSRFVANPDPASPFEKRARLEMTTEWPEDPAFRAAMLSILVHYRVRLEREYRGNLRAVVAQSPTLARETAAFRRKQDPMSRFVFEWLARSPTSNTPLENITDRYARWYQDAFGRRPQTRNLATMFTNSILHAYIKRVQQQPGADGPVRDVYMVEGVRIRADRGDVLGEGETLFDDA